jgi:hypothetical protein
MGHSPSARGAIAAHPNRGHEVSRDGAPERDDTLIQRNAGACDVGRR